jgi:hypothetical protein
VAYSLAEEVVGGAGYNAQIAASADQLIVAVSLGQSTNDQACFVPMMHATQKAAEQLHAFTGNDDHVVGTVLADAGYAAEANLAAPGPDRLIALGKGRDQSKAGAGEPAQGPPPADATLRQAMSHRLRTEERKASTNDAAPPWSQRSGTSRRSSTASPAAA